jgi:hypothetical protein
MSFLKRFFETFCEHAPRNKLCGCTNFIIFRPTNQKLWETKYLGEVWARQASVGANQQELTTCAKKSRQEEEGEFCKGGVMGTHTREASNCWSFDQGQSQFTI